MGYLTQKEKKHYKKQLNYQNNMDEYLKKFILKNDGSCYDVFKEHSPSTRLSLGWYKDDGITLTPKGMEQLKIINNNYVT